MVFDKIILYVYLQILKFWYICNRFTLWTISRCSVSHPLKSCLCSFKKKGNFCLLDWDFTITSVIDGKFPSITDVATELEFTIGYYWLRERIWSLNALLRGKSREKLRVFESSINPTRIRFVVWTANMIKNAHMSCRVWVGVEYESGKLKLISSTFLFFC